MELTLGSETSTHFNQTPGLYPKENTLHQQHGENLNLKTKKIYFCRIFSESDKTVLTGLDSLLRAQPKSLILRRIYHGDGTV
jgi:hypothetical protein